MNAVTAKEISKRFGAIQALQNVTIEVKEGELFGIIGPDGAGKTTLFRILTTLLLPDTGTATVDGLAVQQKFQEIRKRVGYMPGRFSLYPDLTVEENLTFFATLFNTSIGENYELVKDIYSQIEKFKTRKAGALSGGMKQKLALSCALIHRPRVLFLDEPTTGVDAVSRREFWELLRNLQKQSITIVVSTPYMDEASLCDRVALLQGGKILDIDTPAGITNRFGHVLWSAKASRMYDLMIFLRQQSGVISCYPFGQEHHVVLTQELSVESLQAVARQAGLTDLTMTRISPGIEDCFMSLMTQESKTEAA